MRPTVHTPDTPLHLRIEFNPVRGVHPFLWHTSSRTDPGLPAILAAKKTNICCGDELPIEIKRIKVVAVGGGYIKSRGDPSAFAGFARINCDPARASIGRTHRPSQICPVADVGILLCHTQRQRILAPIRSESFRDPRIVDICGGLSGRIAVLFPNRSPM